MGRRKIEIKAIKDDRNRSVTFLKRKGGLFKKAHELSVLCSVDVAVFIFGSNKKLYEYSSSDMRDLINRYAYHGGPNEHKGPSDFNGGADEDEEEDENATPPHGDGMDHHMMPQPFQGQPPFSHIRHQTPSASPPMANGMTFAQHAAQGLQRGHTPQPVGSRPGSRNDVRRMGPNMVPQPVGPPGPPQGPPVNSFAYIPHTAAIYNPQNAPNMPPSMPQPGPQYPYSQPPPPLPPPSAPQMQPYMNNQRQSSVPPSFPAQHPQQPPPPLRHSLSPPQQQHGLPSQPMPHISPPQPQPPQIQSPLQPPPAPQIKAEPPTLTQPQPQPQTQPLPLPQPQPQPQPQLQIHEPPPVPVEPKPVVSERPPARPLLDTTTSAIKKLPQRKGGHSIFTPIDENRSMLSQHLDSFMNSEPRPKSDVNGNRSQSLDVGATSRDTTSPPQPRRADSIAAPPKRTVSVSSIPETTFTPPSRSDSLRVSGAGPSRPRLKVQIPDEQSDGGSNTAESTSAGPGQSTDATSQTTRRGEPVSSGVVLPPPSPSASVILSAGATGPPNPFARPPPANQTHMNIDTPGSALPSRFIGENLLPSPSSFYPDWNYPGRDSNTLPSPLNFQTPVVGSGPSFLRDDAPNSIKRKSPEISSNGPTSDPIEPGNEAKRPKLDG